MKKLFNVLLTLFMVYAIMGISDSLANTISPAINEVKLPQGQRSISSLKFFNGDDKDIDIILSVYEYNPETEEIIKDGKNIFLKVDTDTFVVGANSEQEIKYEIYPLSNLQLGTYFNVLVVTEVTDSKNVYINQGISQLVVLHIIDPDQSVKGIATNSYITDLKIINKGIPFITPAKIKYTITNNSNYVITPSGRIEIFNKRNDYKPEYIYINEDKNRVYPKECIEESYEVDAWHISDIFSERIVIGNFYNGLDNDPQRTEAQINSYIYEILGILAIIIVIFMLIKSMVEDKRKSKKVS
jgi:hypothetical protein